MSWASNSPPISSPASGSKIASIGGVEGSQTYVGSRKDPEGVTGGGAIDRTSRPLCGTSNLSSAGSTCKLGFTSSALTEGNPDLVVDFRLLLLDGRLALEGEDVEGFAAEGSSDLQKVHCQRRGGYHDKDIQFWYTIRIFLEEKADNLRIFHVRLEAFSLEKRSS